jgi:hypothetical protein
MLLFMDIDETLLYALPPQTEEYMRPANRTPDAILQLDDGNHSIYLRGDIDLLADIPFSIFTSGTRDYALGVAGVLRERMFDVGEVYSRDDTVDPFTSDDEGAVHPPLTNERGLLIDDLPAGSAGIESKMRRLPNFKHCHVDAWMRMTHPKKPKSSKKEDLAEFRRNRRWVVDYNRSSGTKSLKQCLKAAGLYKKEKHHA